ncbi:MAG: hypothetical protein ACE5WD_01150 [Candidatus Aminicenantia bacterium]
MLNLGKGEQEGKEKEKLLKVVKKEKMPAFSPLFPMCYALRCL